MKMRNLISLLGIVLLGLSLVFAGCSGGGSSGTTIAGAGGGAPSFNVKGSSQLISLSNTVAASSKPSANIISRLFGKPEPFQYQIVNQGLSDEEVRARLKGKAASGAGVMGAITTPSLKGTNLLAIAPDGTATLAIKSDFLIKAMYTVADPKGEYVYIALDTGFIKPDGNDYTPFIASTNCAFYRVKISDNSSSCVKEGVYVQPIDDQYNETVSSNVRPIQFDDLGNVYFAASLFNRTCTEDSCNIFVADWNPRIYRMAADGSTVLTLTQDNQKISYYLAMKTGELAYQSRDNNGTTIYFWQPGQSLSNPNGVTINLTGPTNWIDFFAADTYNSIMYGGFRLEGVNQYGTTLQQKIRFVKPGTSGILKAQLDTSLFKAGWNAAPVPKKIIVGDDGKLYGVFGPTPQDVDIDPAPPEPGGNQHITWKTFMFYKVFQILPGLSVPRVEIGYDPTLPYVPINVFGSTPFQVANGYFFYKETKEKTGFGTRDIINMVNLNTRKVTPLLQGENTVYEIYSWRVRGKKLYFSALDLAKTNIVSGEIDTNLVALGRLESEFLTTQNMASALGATSRVQDIEGLEALPSITGSSAPTVQQFTTSADNRNSVSMLFSKLMNEASVESALTFTTSSIASPAPDTMKIWIQNALHLIPDLDDNGTGLPDDALLDLGSTTPLPFDTSVTFGVDASATDRAGNAMSAAATKTFRTAPYNGWYVAEDHVNFAGANDLSNANVSGGWYDLNVYAASGVANVPADFRFQFRARNTQYMNFMIGLYDRATLPFSNALYNCNAYGGCSYGAWSMPVRMYMWNGGAEIDYATFGYPWNYSYGYDPVIFNGNWMYYRLDVYGTTAKLSYSSDGSTWTYLPAYSQVANLVARTSGPYSLIIRNYDKGFSLDDIKIWALNSSGVPLSGTPFYDVNFDGRQNLTDAPALDGSVENYPSLINRITGAAPFNFIGWW